MRFFIKCWLTLSFSKEMWGSMFFILFYVMLVVSHVYDFQPWRLPQQAALFVGLALFMGLLGTAAGWVKHRDKLKQLRDINAELDRQNATPH